MLLPVEASRASKRHQLKSKRAVVQQNIHKKAKKLHLLKKKEAQTRHLLYSVEHRVRAARGQLHAATLRLERTKMELRHANQDFKDAQAAFAVSQKKASIRIVATYARGEEGYIQFLIDSASFADLLERVQLAKFMREEDRDTLQELKERKEEVAVIQRRVQSKTREEAAWRQQVAIWHQRTIQEQCLAAENLHEVKGQREEMESEYNELIRESNAIESMLQQMENTPQGRRRYHRIYAGGFGSLPVRGRITSPFGWRIHPISGRRRMHTGVDIAAPIGTPIAAAGGGEIIWAGRRGGYGNAVMIDHGRGITTLYGHMSAINVRRGQVVRRGQCIGWVGSTGYSTGPHCHFEKRINGRPVNPLR